MNNEYNKNFDDLLEASENGIIYDNANNQFRLDPNTRTVSLVTSPGTPNKEFKGEQLVRVVEKLAKYNVLDEDILKLEAQSKQKLTRDIVGTSMDSKTLMPSPPPPPPQPISLEEEVTPVQQPSDEPNVGLFQKAQDFVSERKTSERGQPADYSEVTDEQVAQAQTRKDAMALGIVAAQLASTGLNNYDVSIKRKLSGGKLFQKRPPPAYIQLLNQKIEDYLSGKREGLDKADLERANRALRSTKKQIAEQQERQQAAQASTGGAQLSAAATQMAAEASAKALGQVAADLEISLTDAAMERAAQEAAEYEQAVAQVSAFEVAERQQQQASYDAVFGAAMKYAIGMPLKIAPTATA
tara:strand:+ start:88 stop:1152 length:1065 start_codon:yes stop_codon:yes gene_type:complete